MAKKRTPMNKIKRYYALSTTAVSQIAASLLALNSARPPYRNSLLALNKANLVGLCLKVVAILISLKLCITARKPVAIKSCQTSLNTLSNSDVKI